MMRRFALAVAFCTLVAGTARASDPVPADDKVKDPVAADRAKTATPESAQQSDAQSTLPAPTLQKQSGSLAGATVLRSLHVSLAISQAYDYYSTQQAIRRGAVEMNPLMQNTVASKAAFAGLKVAMTLGPILEAEHLWRDGHRAGAIALMAAANGIMMSVAAHNAGVMNNAVTVR